MQVRLTFFGTYEQEIAAEKPFSQEREIGFIWLAEPVVPREGEVVLVHELTKRLLAHNVLEGELPPDGDYEVRQVTYTFAADGELRAAVFCFRIT